MSYEFFITVTIPTSKIQKATLAKRSTPQTIDDRNPDLIPLSKGKYLQMLLLSIIVTLKTILNQIVYISTLSLLD